MITQTPWKRHHVEIIDQRETKLPAVWLATSKSPSVRYEGGHTVHESGPERIVASMVISLLQQASVKVVMSSFLLADQSIEDELLLAAKRGVRVYVLLASEARLGLEDAEREFEKKVFQQHKDMLVRLGGHVLFRSAPHFHAKVVIVDPAVSPGGLLLTSNLTSEALERNEELAISLTREQVAEVCTYLKWAMWESAEHELVDPTDGFKVVNPLGKVPHPRSGSSIVATTSNMNTLYDEVIRLVDSANSRIVVSSFGWDRDNKVVARLCERARSGVDVTVLTRVREVSTPALLVLAEAGAKVFGFKWLHAKAIWVDTQEALVMSANLQAAGLDHGFELGVRLAERSAGEVLERLERWCDRAEWRFASALSLGDAIGVVKLWRGGRLVGCEIKRSIDVDLGTVTASSAHDLVECRPALEDLFRSLLFAHEQRCTWTVLAPKLATHSKEVLREGLGKHKPVSYTPAVFREPDGRIVVVIRSHEELKSAEALMPEVSAVAIVLSQELIW